jgi:hypothetical protein
MFAWWIIDIYVAVKILFPAAKVKAERLIFAPQIGFTEF